MVAIICAVENVIFNAMGNPVERIMKGSIMRRWFGCVRVGLLACVLCAAMSGCAAVGPLLTAGGTLFAPLQYASAVYTASEFTYEYAKNGKTPDEVIQGKVDSLAAVFDNDEAAVPEKGEQPVMLADAEGERMDSLLAGRRVRSAQERIELRNLQMQSLERRKMAFLEAREKNISLRGGVARQVDLGYGAQGDVTLN